MGDNQRFVVMCAGLLAVFAVGCFVDVKYDHRLTALRRAFGACEIGDPAKDGRIVPCSDLQ